MLKKNKFVKVIFYVLVIAFLAVVMIGIFMKDDVYEGSGLTYIVEDDGKCKIAVINSKGEYEKEVGRTKDIFWLASFVDEDETVSVDNNNRIYKFMQDKVETFVNIESNIMAVLKVAEKYVLIREDETTVYISLYSNNFKEELDEQQVSGTLEHCFVMGDTVYYSVNGDEEQFTGVYKYSVENVENEMLYYNDKESEEIYPFVYEEKVYLAKNTLVRQSGNVDVLELYEMYDAGECKKILDLEQPLRKVIIVDKEVYGLEGVNTTVMTKMDLSTSSKEILFTLDNESALGLYYFEGKIHLLTDRAVYEMKNNKLVKKEDVETLNLVNKFY